MWYNFFDKIWCFNLPERRDRYWISTWEFARYGIPVEWIKAVKSSDPRSGLYQTMKEMFERALSEGYERILVFEDDVQFLCDPGPVMDKALAELPPDWDLLYLGCNLATQPGGFYSEHLLPVSRALSTHAVAYSKVCMERFVRLPKLLPVDVLLTQTIQQAGRSFCTCPMIVSQHPGFSDIMRMNVDWSDVLQKRFGQHTEPLLRQETYKKCCIIE